LAAIDLEKMPIVPEERESASPIRGARQFIALGLNYRKHADEAGMAIPKDPLVFNEAITCIQGPDGDVICPEGCRSQLLCTKRFELFAAGFIELLKNVERVVSGHFS
jgi:2,4-didehydro-3-deoxy-L-rhamnonate hydrolase